MKAISRSKSSHTHNLLSIRDPSKPKKVNFLRKQSQQNIKSIKGLFRRKSTIKAVIKIKESPSSPERLKAKAKTEKNKKLIDFCNR